MGDPNCYRHVFEAEIAPVLHRDSGCDHSVPPYACGCPLHNLEGSPIVAQVRQPAVPLERRSEMAWKTPRIVEVPVGMEINMYVCAARK
jgi:coenzyme PQQ precursor peptide PqqA